MAKKKSKKKVEKSVASYTKTVREIKIHSLFPADCKTALARLSRTKKDITFNDILKEVLKGHGKLGLSYPKGVKKILFG